MLKTYLSKHNISIYHLSKMSGVPYSTLNDLANFKLPVDNLRSGQLRAIANALCMDMDTLYDICQLDVVIKSSHYDIEATVGIAHKTYYLYFEKNGRAYKCDIIPVKSESTTYLETLAQWKLDEKLSQLEMEAAYETIHAKKT